jgi:hypothetical protein
MDSYEDFLEDVIGNGCVTDTAFNKPVELAVIVLPYLLGVAHRIICLVSTDLTRVAG